MKANTMFQLSLTSIAAALLVSACGNGGGTSAPASSATNSDTGTVNVSLTDGPGEDFTHVWVTVTQIAFHMSPDSSWNASDATWKTYTLQNPVTIDLAQLNNGALNKLFAGIKLPVGTYKQIRIFLDGHDQLLDKSAKSSLDGNNTALQWNDQVEFKSGTTITEAPLEIANFKEGIQLNGSFSVAKGSTLDLAVDFDLEHIIVPFDHGGQRYYTLKPNLHYFDLSKVGAITGKLDKTAFCPDNTVASTCASRIMIKAEVPSSNNSRYMDVRATTPKPDGSFILYPLDTKDSKGNLIQYHIVIRGRNMETLVVKNVPATAGTTPSSAQSQLQPGPISLKLLNGSGYLAQLASPLKPLTSGNIRFEQTDASVGIPYEIRFANVDPFNGKLWTPEPLENSGLRTASFASGATLSFAEASVKEGSGIYGAVTDGMLNYGLSAPATVTSAKAGAISTFTANAPALLSGVQSGLINGQIKIGTLNKYTNGQLILTHLSHIVTTQDISSTLTSSGGSYSFTGIPAGSNALPVASASYSLILRLWAKGVAPKLVPIATQVDLRKTDKATVNITTP